MQITIDLLSGTFVGAFIGYELDKFFATKPLCFIVFMILGIAGGFWNMLKRLK
ncbi:MAG: AtpZ/AtpI family protein [Rickettsiales bacterium]|nr:AtpZ/AtpI family protein [Rickettsiales bacterium]